MSLINHVNTIFAKHDKDKDGFLNVAEFTKYLREQTGGDNSSEFNGQASRVFESLGTEIDGLCSKKELLEYIAEFDSGK